MGCCTMDTKLLNEGSLSRRLLESPCQAQAHSPQPSRSCFGRRQPITLQRRKSWQIIRTGYHRQLTSPRRLHPPRRSRRACQGRLGSRCGRPCRFRRPGQGRTSRQPPCPSQQQQFAPDSRRNRCQVFCRRSRHRRLCRSACHRPSGTRPRLRRWRSSGRQQWSLPRQ